MNQGPSENLDLVMTIPSDSIYRNSIHDKVEQSAIYSNILFQSIPEKSNGIVLTCQCDFIGDNKTDYVLLARVADLEMFFYYWLSLNRYPGKVIAGEKPIPEKLKNRDNILQMFVNRYMMNKTYGYYFLPKLNNKLSNSLITFDTTTCISVDKLKPGNKICVLKSPFRECVPAKYGAFIGRIGTPDYPKKFLRDIADSICKLRDN